jgi:uncharacterized protein YndB with AHSA1/START domain
LPYIRRRLYTFPFEQEVDVTIDWMTQLGAVTRSVRSVERDGKAAEVIAVARTFGATADDLWNAITVAERLGRWFGPVAGELRLGGRYKMGKIGGTILRCDPPSAFAVTWEHWGDVSWVEVRLTPESAERTRLELEHTMLTGDHWQEYGPGAGGVGWDLSLLGLDRFLVEGRWSEAACSASPEGKDFSRASAEEWGRAHIAAGASPEEARAAAKRNAAFYTGSKTWAMLGWLVRATKRATSRWTAGRMHRA